ncbi:MAG TPA: hypothetical protein DEO94_01865 [Cyanobacteria bacterium UBA11991]|nr:hypothetical protein [Cyanobacteriota bacterium]MDY6364672.1 hypothetical protein [Cyanobacteriota bacterium]HCB10902.1 hypothetical protein [Cyanobacteria bacterium UBA11991]
MKRFIILSLIAFFTIALHANGACLLQDLKDKSTCTGGASNINSESSDFNSQDLDKQELRKMYKIPTMSVPQNFSPNGFPALNQNCMFGACFPDLR